MARSNGPFGPAGTRPPARRHPADDPYAPPHGQPGAHNGQWPSAPYPDLGSAGQQGQGYHFPPEPEPNNYDYGQPASPPYYANGMQQPPYPPQQQWSQQPDPRGYDLGNYMPAAPQQPYPPVDPNQFRQPQDHAYAGQRQGYADPDAEYDDEEFVDGDEPRRGRRWMFVAAAALIGAIGVGGALAYTYKSLFAPSSGRVPIVRADQGNKAKPTEKMLGRLSDDASQQAGAPGSEPQDDRSGEESGGPKRVKTIPINPGAPMVAGVSASGSQVSPSMPGVMVDIGPRPQLPPPKTNQPLIGQQPLTASDTRRAASEHALATAGAPGRGPAAEANGPAAPGSQAGSAAACCQGACATADHGEHGCRLCCRPLLAEDAHGRAQGIRRPAATVP